jgi:hypothetical protein
MKLTMIRQILAAVAVSSVSGCIFPVHLADEEPFRDETIGFIERNATSRESIRESIGQPQHSFMSGRLWVYHGDQKSTEWLWIMCGGYGACGGDTLGGDVVQYNFFVFFDEQDIVRDFEVSVEDSHCIREDTVCYEAGFLRLKQLDEFAEATSPEHCRLNMFVSRLDNPHRPIWLEFDTDDFESETAFIGHDKQFLVFYLPVGPRIIDIDVKFPFEFAETVRFQCEQEMDLFLQLHYERSDNAWARIVDPVTARTLIAAKDLVVVADNEVQ